LQNEVVDDQPMDALPTFDTLVRIANRCREAMRPTAPRDLSFTLEADKLPPNFLRADVVVGHRRHLVFATDRQLELLATARRWYIDGTFYVVREPFSQLVSIHAFIQHDGNRTALGNVL